MTRDLGVWTAPDCALVRIDYQEEMFEVSPSIPSEPDGIEPIDRSSMNAWEDHAVRPAVEATGRMRLIVGGLHTEICIAFERLAASAHGGH
jgi:nicotinamidase-related amidase